MRKGIAILVLVVYALGATDVHQVLKIPLLVLHYQAHKRNNPSLSFGEFLKVHYIDPQPFDSDYMQDMRLPFKAPEDYCIAAPTILPAPVMLSVPREKRLENNHSVIEEDMPALYMAKSIFQPPRAVPVAVPDFPGKLIENV